MRFLATSKKNLDPVKANTKHTPTHKGKETDIQKTSQWFTVRSMLQVYRLEGRSRREKAVEYRDVRCYNFRQPLLKDEQGGREEEDDNDEGDDEGHGDGVGALDPEAGRERGQDPAVLAKLTDNYLALLRRHASSRDYFVRSSVAYV